MLNGYGRMVNSIRYGAEREDILTNCVLAYAGIFFLGFGGSRWISETTINYYKTISGMTVSPA